jgi:putative sterol carrier protein
MTDLDIGKLTPSQLVDLLAALDPTSSTAQQLDVDAIGRAVDPRKLRRPELVEILAQVERLSSANLTSLGAHTFARLINRASADQLRDVLARPTLRLMILDEIFRRMEAHLRIERTRTTQAVVHWRFPTDTDYDRYETIIDKGTCTSTRDHTRDPRVTITLSPYDFLRLITSNASAPVLFMTGKLKVRGDLAFAASLMSLFDLPRP